MTDTRISRREFLRVVALGPFAAGGRADAAGGHAGGERSEPADSR